MNCKKLGPKGLSLFYCVDPVRKIAAKLAVVKASLMGERRIEQQGGGP